MSSSSSEKPTCSRLASSSTMTDKIIDYYQKFGKDREIEKFMRLSRSKSVSTDNSEYLIDSEVLGVNNASSKTIDKPLNEENLNLDKEEIPTTQREAATPSPVQGVDREQIPAPDSVTKNDKKLEWDSLADVGYKKSSSTGNLSSLERSVLKELFAESPSEPNISLQRSNDAATSSSLSLTQKYRRERWRKTLETISKKYSSFSASMDTQEFSDQPQSTPKPPPQAEQSCQTSFDKQKPRNQQTDHACQTSFDYRKSSRPSKAFQSTQTSAGSLKSQDVPTSYSSRMGSLTTQSSFEYQAGESSSSSAKRNILSERNSNSSKHRPSSDSDKENQVGTQTKKPNNEVDLGIKLLCSLIDAKNLSSSQKKTLAKKIFEKIMKEQSSTSLSTTGTSRSSAVSGSSLIENSPSYENNARRSEAASTSGSKCAEQVSEETKTESPKETASSATTSSSREEPVTTREWLNPLTRSEKDYDKKHKKRAVQAAQSAPAQVSERQKQLAWIEVEIDRLEGLKNLLIKECTPKSRTSSSKSTAPSSGRTEVIYEETAEDVVDLDEDCYKRTTRRTSQNVVIYDEPTADDGKQPETVKYKTTRVIIDEERSTFSNSPKNRRSKLETPPSSASSGCESVSAFADQLQKQFLENYSKKERCASEHYSEPRVCGKPVFTRNPSYTSVASSSFCMSSEMSIPIVESSSSSTTTHQYDSNGCESIEGVAVQTTYSIIKTNPIFGPRCKCICTCGQRCKCSCPRPTIRVSGKAYHQTVQVKPKALAYVIRFTGASEEERKKASEERLTLQQHLAQQNPEFVCKANQRREILKRLHALRQEREQQIREIAESSNISSIPRKLEQLPPPAIKQARIGPTKEMKGMTKKRYDNLPEVVAKKERERKERQKRATRLLASIFNKKLQRMVHDGKLSLEYSRTVI